jgi:nucleoside-diphosphate-sugar epimerase
VNVAITGVAGFVGSNLANRLLDEGHRVVGIDNLAYGVREQVPAGVEFLELDIRDRTLAKAFGGIEVVFHLAAKNCISDCQADPIETSDINVTGTANVFEAARRAGIRKVVYAESSALYEGSQLLPTPESDVHPQSFYAVSKFAGMAFADAYRRFFDLHSTALRYFCVYGPRQDYRRTIPPLMSAFSIKMLRGERPTIYGSGVKRRDFVYVDDVNDFHLQCMTDERTTDNVYNIGSGTNASVREIYDQIAALTGFGQGPIYQPDMPGEAQDTLADITAARALGWSPRTSLNAGLALSLEYIKHHVVEVAASIR